MITPKTMKRNWRGNFAQKIIILALLRSRKMSRKMRISLILSWRDCWWRRKSRTWGWCLLRIWCRTRWECECRRLRPWETVSKIHNNSVLIYLRSWGQSNAFLATSSHELFFWNEKIIWRRTFSASLIMYTTLYLTSNHNMFTNIKDNSFTIPALFVGGSALRSAILFSKL